MSRNYKGGYKIIDLQNIALLSGGKIDGIYEKIEASYRKPILLSGIVISGVEKNDVMTKPEVSETSFVFRDIYGYDVTVEDDDTISVASTQIATREYVDSKIKSPFIKVNGSDNVINKVGVNNGVFINLTHQGTYDGFCVVESHNEGVDINTISIIAIKSDGHCYKASYTGTSTTQKFSDLTFVQLEEVA